jgi:hypothetical protein
VKRGSRPLASLFRVALLGVFAALLLVRLGPFCEAAAQAAPIATAMTGCEGKGVPAKKAPASACATPCAAVQGETIARVEPLRFPTIAPMPATAPGLAGQPVPPATPPPRSV